MRIGSTRNMIDFIEGKMHLTLFLDGPGPALCGARRNYAEAIRQGNFTQTFTDRESAIDMSEKGKIYNICPECKSVLEDEEAFGGKAMEYRLDQALCEERNDA